MKKLIFLTLIIVPFVASHGSAFAAGLGFFSTAEIGTGEFEIEDSFGNELYDDDGDTARLGIGFVFDTAVARDKLFNYRLNVSVVRLDIELDDVFNSEAELAGVAFDNTFGFGVLRTEKVRLWVGPRIRLGFYGGDADSFSGNDDDVTAVDFGVGGALGANFHVGPAVSLGFETGVMISGYGGEIETGFGDLDLVGGATSLFLNGVVLFRLSGD